MFYSYKIVKKRCSYLQLFVKYVATPLEEWLICRKRFNVRVERKLYLNYMLFVGEALNEFPM